MNLILVMIFLFFGPILLLLVFLALSSCLGDKFRARLRGSPGDSYGREYLRTMTNTGSAMSEQIELDNMYREYNDDDDDDDERGR